MKKILRRAVSLAFGSWTKLERMQRILGLSQSLTIWWKERRYGAGTLLQVRVKSFQTPLYLRARSSDLEVLLKVFSDHEYHLPLLKTPQSILDGGANVGYATVLFAKLFPAAVIVAVEPDRSNLAVLHRNCAGLKNVQVIEAALWSHDTEVELEDPGMAEHAFRVSGLAKTAAVSRRKVPALSLVSLAKMQGLTGFEMVKLDIEGAEKKVLSDAAWLSHCQVLVAELHDRFVAGCSKQFYLAIHDYDGDYLMGENTIAFRRGWISDKFIEQGYWAASTPTPSI
jgi:FkbM family methyltransferase